MIKCALCNGEGKWPYDWKLCPQCYGDGEIDDSGLSDKDCAACSGTGTHPYAWVRCARCGGTGKRPKKEQGNIFVFSIEAGNRDQGYQTLAGIFENLAGHIKVADPYYGTRSLASLALLTKAKSVQFLTKKRDSNNKTFIDQRVADFTAGNPKYEVRKYSGTDLHDRYVLTEDHLILVGHGIKDIGNRESFVVQIDRSIAGEIIDSTHKAFDQKWRNSQTIEGNKTS